MLRPGDILFEGNFIVPANYSTLELPSVKADWSNINSKIKISYKDISSTFSKEDLLEHQHFTGINATVIRDGGNTLSIHAFQYNWSITKIELV